MSPNEYLGHSLDDHRTGKAEKCTFCFPRIEAGQPTICSETCVGRLRYLGLILYDADRVLGAAATPDERHLYQAQLDVFLDPNDPAVQAEADKAGIPRDWVEAAQRCPHRPRPAAAAQPPDRPRTVAPRPGPGGIPVPGRRRRRLRAATVRRRCSSRLTVSLMSPASPTRGVQSGQEPAVS
jgi:4Fe-4S dicluster domain